MTPYFFGYGSLVNRQTHFYPDAHPARLLGWRRAWVRTAGRKTVYLSVIPDQQSSIDGLIAAVPGADWAALDAREHGYARVSSGGSVVHPLVPTPDIAHYAVALDKAQDAGDHVILLSYLDVVIQGFLAEFGEGGVHHFFETTDNWAVPVLDDRATPRYPRHQVLSRDEMALVDHHLGDLSARVE